MINPFNITRAVDLTNKEIEELWVDIARGEGFVDVVKPTSSMPMIILGAKGCGKTHLLRYCSYPLQKIRNDNCIKNILKEGYIGIYYRSSGLNSNRFTGKGIKQETWNSVFDYYLEIWLVTKLLKVCNEIIAEYSDFNELVDEYKLSNEILNLFDTKLTKKRKVKLSELISILFNIQKQIDLSVNESALTGELKNFNIASTPGHLIFGVPKLLGRNISYFDNIQFLFLIDEFENLNEDQQRFVNTLLRDKEIPTSFKIGSRLYGVRTYKTLSANEENKEGSEFEKFVIDEYFRKYSDFSSFIKKVCVNRLLRYGYSSEIKFWENPKLLDNINNFFETENKATYCKFLAKVYYDKNLLPPYLEKLKNKLNKNKISHVNEIIKMLRVPDNPLLERTNVFIFYRAWKTPKGKDLYTHSKEIKDETILYLNGNYEKNRVKIVLDKFKSDIEDQLILECNGKLHYSGIETFIKISTGITRVFLKILKHIFQISSYNEEKPFSGGVISIESQTKGVLIAANWFFEDARLKGPYGKIIKDSITRLARFLREIRFSDLPPECSLCSFTVDLSTVSENTNRHIELAEQYSYIVRIADRHDKNTKNIKPTFQINGILATMWDLPLSKRGDLSISGVEANSIFDSTDEEHFNYVLKKRLSLYNFPFNKKKSFETESLFN